MNRAAGKFVIDMNPKSPRDSIPARIDQKHPARLDSGEYVLTQEQVAALGGPKGVQALLARELKTPLQPSQAFRAQGKLRKFADGATVAVDDERKKRLEDKAAAETRDAAGAAPGSEGKPDSLWGYATDTLGPAIAADLNQGVKTTTDALNQGVKTTLDGFLPTPRSQQPGPGSAPPPSKPATPAAQFPTNPMLTPADAKQAADRSTAQALGQNTTAAAQAIGRLVAPPGPQDFGAQAAPGVAMRERLATQEEMQAGSGPTVRQFESPQGTLETGLGAPSKTIKLNEWNSPTPDWIAKANEHARNNPLTAEQVSRALSVKDPTPEELALAQVSGVNSPESQAMIREFQDKQDRKAQQSQAFAQLPMTSADTRETELRNLMVGFDGLSKEEKKARLAQQDALQKQYAGEDQMRAKLASDFVTSDRTERTQQAALDREAARRDADFQTKSLLEDRKDQREARKNEQKGDSPTNKLASTVTGHLAKTYADDPERAGALQQIAGQVIGAAPPGALNEAQLTGALNQLGSALKTPGQLRKEAEKDLAGWFSSPTEAQITERVQKLHAQYNVPAMERFKQAMRG